MKTVPDPLLNKPRATHEQVMLFAKQYRESNRSARGMAGNELSGKNPTQSELEQKQ